MNISIAGTGYVGLSTGVGFANKGNKVICVDIDMEKVEKINRRESPIYEPGMEESLKDVVDGGYLKATTDLKSAIMDSDVTFISVPTPQSADGSADLSYIESAAEEIGKALKLKKGYHVVAVKSTVPPGTTENVVLPALKKYSGKKPGSGFGVCMNPEFLREGRALEDFLRPDRVVIGCMDERSGKALEELYSGFDAPILKTGIKAAEMIKYASNAFLATKISFSNEIGNICKKLGIDVYDVMKGVGMDSRISPAFLSAGAGFGGSCFTKDVAALVAKAQEMGCDADIMKSTLKVNKDQREKVADMIHSMSGGVKGKKIAVLGLSFKPDSDDIREAPSIEIIRSLKESGARVSAYDPKAMENMKKVHQDIEYCKNILECLSGADLCLLLTEWDDFKGLSDREFSAMKGSAILEARKILDPVKVSRFSGVCWPGNEMIK